MRLSLFLALASALALLSGCARHSAYAVAPIHYETVPGKVDGQWFERTINVRDGLSTIELVYCPILPRESTVCRTAIVYRYDHSTLIEGK